MAGILYGWIGVYYAELAQMADTWGFHYESIKEHKLLVTDPLQFFSSIFQNSYQEGYTKFLAVENSWWNDLKGTIFIKLLAVFNLLSFGNYYVNVIFFSFITMFGPVAIFRLMNETFRAKLPVLLATFLVPSFLYWTSGLHKDGLVFLGMALISYYCYFALRDGFNFFRIAMVVFGGLLVLTLRNFVIIPIIPAVVAFILSSKIRRFRPVVVFSAVYFLFIVLFFSARFIHPRLNFPEEVVVRQEAFLKLGGGSAVDVNRLEPTLWSFLENLPQAFSLAAIRPHPGDVHHLLSLAAAAEINFIILLVLVAIIFWRRPIKLNPFILFCLFLSLSVLLMIGYTVNVLGAIVRYRSIALTLLLIPIIAQADWRRVEKMLAGKHEQ